MTLQQAVMLVLRASILMTVFGIGLQATPADFLFPLRRPSLFARSLLAMLVVMPIVALALARAFELRPSVEIVLVAFALSPIPPLLPRRQREAGGDRSYAVALMAIVGVLSIASIPLGARVVGRYFGQPFAMSPRVIAAAVLEAAVLPLVAGLLFRAMLPAAAARVTKPIGVIANVLLAVGVVALLAPTLTAVFALIGNGTILGLAAFVIAGLATGHVLGGPEADDRVVLAFATACRHPAIALAIAKANFPDEPDLGATVILYALVNLIIGIAYNNWQKRTMAATA